MRDSSNLIVQRFLTLPIIYLNFLLSLITQPGTLLILNSNSDMWCSQFSTRSQHMTYIHDTQWSHATFLISFQIPTCNDHLTHIHNMCWSHAALLISFGFWHAMIMTYIHDVQRSHDALLTVFQTQLSKFLESLYFSLSSSDWNRPKNGHTSWLTVWINTNIGQLCCHDYTRLCMAMQGCVKAE